MQKIKLYFSINIKLLLRKVSIFESIDIWKHWISKP